MAYIHLTRLFFDFETEAHPNVSSLIPEPEAPVNYKDEAKIQAYKEEKWQRALEQAALDPDYGRISAFGWRVGTQGPNMPTEQIDQADSLGEANYLLGEYQQVYRHCGTVWLKRATVKIEKEKGAKNV